MFAVGFTPILLAGACAARVASKSGLSDARLVWGSTPILNNIYWSRAMKQAGYQSETFTTLPYTRIDKRDHWDRVIDEEYRWAWRFRPYIAFLTSLFRYDVFFIPATGFFLGSTPIWQLQHLTFRIAGKKVVFLPYGSDSYVYRRVHSLGLLHGLMASYPDASREQSAIAKRLDYWIKYADVVIPGFMAGEGFGRWDVFVPSPLVIDLNKWTPSTRSNQSDGSETPVVVAHAPNHRGFKGTEFVIAAVEKLRSEGFRIELRLIEGLKNDEVRRVLRDEADILIEQLVFPGYALNAIEGMASGIPVISNLGTQEVVELYRRFSYLSECPIVPSTPEDITDTLRGLVLNPSKRQLAGSKGRSYVERYHSLEAGQRLFESVLRYLRGQSESIPYAHRTQ